MPGIAQMWGRLSSAAKSSQASRNRASKAIGSEGQRTAARRLKNGSFSTAEKSITASPRSRQPRPGMVTALV